MAIWGALIGAAASAYSANRSANAQADAARSANALDLGTFREGNDFNRAEADKARWFNAEEAEKARAFSASSAAEAQQFSAGQADKAREWEKMMSDSSYQRAVGDMKSAGLNPMLAYSQGGASTPGSPSASGIAASSPSASSGAASSGSAPRATPVVQMGKAELMANTASSFLDIERKLAEIDAIKTSTGTGELTNKKMAEDIRWQKLFLESALDNARLTASQKNIVHRIMLQTEDIQVEMARGNKTLQQGNIELQKLQRQLVEAEIPGAKNEAAFENSGLGKSYRFLRETLGLAGSAADIAKPWVKSGDTRPKPPPRSYNQTHYDADGNITGGMSRNYQGE